MWPLHLLLLYAIWGLSKFIETKLQTIYFYITQSFFKKKKISGTSLPASFSAWFAKINISFDFFFDFSFFWNISRDLVPCAQFKKREKNPWRSVTFSKIGKALHLN